jgi:hypothetical protein
MQMSFGKGLAAGAVGAAVVLAITAAASGGYAPPTANSAEKAANVNASLPGSIGTGTFVRGGGHVVTAEVQLNVGQKAALFGLPGYGKFGVACIHAPLAEVDYTVGKRRVHLWTQQGGGASEQDMRPGSGLGIQTGVSPVQTQWTIQDASSARLSANVATVQTDQAVNGNNTSKCDFAAIAYAGP